jgi:peptide/nickel transport system substrate-binding protein
MVSFGRRIFTSGALAGAALVSSHAIAQAPRRGGTIRIGLPTGLPSLDVMATTDDAGRVVNLHIYEPLIGRNEKLEPAPMLAEGWNVSADGLEYAIKLRRGVVFHNGKTMTSADAKASIERYMRMSVRRRYLEDIAEVRAPDPDTVVIRLKSARPLFLNNFSQPEVIVAIIPAEEAAKDANKIEIVGTGPYKLQEYRPDSHVRLVRHDAYVADTRSVGRDGYVGNKQALFDVVEFRIIPESAATVAALEAGEIDMAENMPDKAVPTLKKNPRLRHVNIMPAGMQMVTVNMAMAPLDKLEIRRAIQVALDMDEIMEASTEGNYRLNHALQYPGYKTYPGDRGKQWYNRKDAALAKRLLAEGGYKGERITILSAATFDWHAAQALVMSEQLKAIGLNVAIQSMDWPAIVALRSRPQGWHLLPGRLGTGPWLGDPLISIAGWIGPTPASHFKDDTLYALAQEMENSPSAEVRLEAAMKAQERLNEQVMFIKCGDYGHSQILSARIQGFEPFRTARMWNVWFGS